MLGWELTHYLDWSRSIFCEIGSQLIVWSGAGLSYRVQTRLKSYFQISASSCLGENVGTDRSFPKILWVSIGFWAILCPRSLLTPEDPYYMIMKDYLFVVSRRFYIFIMYIMSQSPQLLENWYTFTIYINTASSGISVLEVQNYRLQHYSL